MTTLSHHHAISTCPRAAQVGLLRSISTTTSSGPRGDHGLVVPLPEVVSVEFGKDWGRSSGTGRDRVAISVSAIRRSLLPGVSAWTADAAASQASG